MTRVRNFIWIAWRVIWCFDAMHPHWYFTHIQSSITKNREWKPVNRHTDLFNALVSIYRPGWNNKLVSTYKSVCLLIRLPCSVTLSASRLACGCRCYRQIILGDRTAKFIAPVIDLRAKFTVLLMHALTLNVIRSIVCPKILSHHIFGWLLNIYENRIIQTLQCSFKDMKNPKFLLWFFLLSSCSASVPLTDMCIFVMFVENH